MNIPALGLYVSVSHTLHTFHIIMKLSKKIPIVRTICNLWSQDIIPFRDRTQNS